MKIKRYNCYATNAITTITTGTTPTTTTTKLPIDFIEVMACPSGGCLNGGGQLKASHKETTIEMNKRVLDVDRLYHVDSASGVMVGVGVGMKSKCVDQNVFTKFVYNTTDTTDIHAISTPLLHTRYHSVPKLEILAPLATKW